jgi:hypothetical protein
LINLNTKLRRVIKLKSVKPTDEVISDRHLEKNIHKVKVDIIEFINALKTRKLKYASSFIDNLMIVLDSHELDKFLEKLIRNLIATIIEKKGLKDNGNR